MTIMPLKTLAGSPSLYGGYMALADGDRRSAYIAPADDCLCRMEA